VGQRGFFQADTVELLPFDLDGRMMSCGGHLLIEDVLDIMGAIGMVYGGLFDGLDQCKRAIVILEGEEFFKVLFDGLIGGGKAFEIGFRFFP